MNNSIEKPEAIFFDWDGTLVDSFGMLQGVHESILEKLDLPKPQDPRWFEEYFGKPRDFIFDGIYGEKTQEGRAYFEQTYRAEHTKHLRSYDDAEILLKTIQDLDITSGVISNKNPVFLTPEIENLGWKPYFSCIIGAGEATADKPSGAPLELACEQTGVQKIWYVGDTENDLLSAQSAGVKFIFIQFPFAEIPKQDENNTFAVFKNLGAMREFLLQCAENWVKG